MNCRFNDCEGRLRVTHTYTEGGSRTQRAVCTECRRPHTIVSTAEPATRRGEGAKARAERARREEVGARAEAVPGPPADGDRG